MPAVPAEPERSTTPSRGDATRARLVEAAHQQFLRCGYHGTSMRQIAEAAGIAVSGIYNHFAGKEEIFAAVLDAYHPYRVILPALEATEGDTAEAFFRDAAGHIRAGIEGVETQLLPLVFMDLVEFQGRHLKELAERVLPSVMGFLQRFMQRHGDLRPLPPPIILRAFMSLMLGYVLTEMALKNSPLFRQIGLNWFDGMVDIFLHGIVDQTLSPPAARPSDTAHAESTPAQDTMIRKARGRRAKRSRSVARLPTSSRAGSKKVRRHPRTGRKPRG